VGSELQTLQGLDVKLVVDPLGKLRPDAGNGAKALAEDRRHIRQAPHLQLDDDVIRAHHLVALLDLWDKLDRIEDLPGLPRVGHDQYVGLDGHSKSPSLVTSCPASADARRCQGRPASTCRHA